MFGVGLVEMAAIIVLAQSGTPKDVVATDQPAKLQVNKKVQFTGPRTPDDYKLGPDSMKQEGVPEGKVTQMPAWKSDIFPGTVRDWWIYVPAQYDEKKPACVMVFQDGGGYLGETARSKRLSCSTISSTKKKCL